MNNNTTPLITQKIGISEAMAYFISDTSAKENKSENEFINELLKTRHKKEYKNFINLMKSIKNP